MVLRIAIRSEKTGMGFEFFRDLSPSLGGVRGGPLREIFNDRTWTPPLNPLPQGDGTWICTGMKAFVNKLGECDSNIKLEPTGLINIHF